MKDLLQWKMWFMVFGTFVDNQGKTSLEAAGKSGTQSSQTADTFIFVRVIIVVSSNCVL